MKKKTLSEVDILQRSLQYSYEDVRPILKYLGTPESDLSRSKSSTRSDALKISADLRKMGSNDIATVLRGGDAVPYYQVVFDVAKKLKVDNISQKNSAECIEREIIKKLFADALDKMSEDEKRILLNSMGITGSEIPYKAAGTLITQLLLKKFGGFAVYRMSLIMANIISRALLGSGLSFATNVALTRAISVLLGPIGWASSGVWLAIDLAGPAYRKTVPAIVHIALLRQMTINRLNIGIVGDGSVGKDALLMSVFGIDTDNVNPIAGSTEDAEIYSLGDTGAINVVNFPGFNDVRPHVNELTNDQLHHTDVFLMVLDLNRGVSGTDVEILKTLKSFGTPILICLNKIDIVRPKNKDFLLKAAKDRLGDCEMIETAFDPDERVHKEGPIGAEKVFDWVKRKLEEDGKETDHLKKESC